MEDENKRLFIIVSTCAALLAAVALLSLAGILIDSAHQPLMNWGLVSLRINAAACILLFSIALVTVRFKRGVLSQFICIAIVVFCGLSLAEDLAGIPTGTGGLFGLVTVPADVSHLAPQGAISIALAAIAFFYCAQRSIMGPFKTIIVTSLASLLSAFGISSIIDRIMTSAADTRTELYFANFAPAAAICCLVASAAIFASAARKSAKISQWLYLPVLFGLVSLVFSLYSSAEQAREPRAGAHVQLIAKEVAGQISVRLAGLHGALERMGVRWNVRGGTPKEEWEADARAYLKGYPDMVSIEWADNEGVLRWVLPEKSRKALLGKNLLKEEARARAFAAARSSGHIQASRTIRLIQGGNGFLYIVPLYSQGKPDGYLIAAFSSQSLVKHILKDSNHSQFRLSIRDGKIPVFDELAATDSKLARLQRYAMADGGAHVWTIAVTPTPKLLRDSDSAVPEAILYGGLVGALLISLSLFFGLKWKERERLLRQSEERYKLAIEGVSVGIWEADLVAGQMYWSPRFLEILGIGDPNFSPVRNGFIRRVHPDDIEKHSEALERHRSSGEPYDVELRVQRDDGTYIWLHMRAQSLRDAEGKTLRTAGSAVDVTAQKEAEVELRASEEAFRSAMEYAASGMALQNPDGRWFKVNKAFALLTGYSEEKLMGSGPINVIHPDFVDEELRLNQQLLSGEIDNYTAERKYIRRDGSSIWVLVNASLVYSADGKPRYIIKQVFDITERKELDRMKSEFISVVSHELRTPLTAIRGSLALMAATMSNILPDKAKRLVEIGHRNSERLITLVNDILDMEKLASGKMELTLTRRSLSQEVRAALEANASYADKFGVSIVVSEDAPELDARIDSDRFAQIMANLLSNAAKFSPRDGQIEIAISENDGKARVSVRDFGDGIPESFRTQIFGKFVQADSSSTRAKGGSGLGLHITKELVERMGGWIGFESETGKGTTFWVEFPIAQEAPVVSQLAVQGGPAGAVLRVLICEDDKEVVDTIRKYLEAPGLVIDVAASVASARECMVSQSYDLMTLDLTLPDGDGLDLLQDIRQQEKTRDLPVIVISTRPGDSDSAEIGALDIVDWITKPIPQDRLNWAVGAAVRRNSLGIPRVLHVEDDADMSSILAAALRGRAELVSAQTLQEAEALLSAERFSLVVLDISLPDGSGLALLEKIKALHSGEIPVVILSANEVSEAVARSVDLAIVKSRMPESRLSDVILGLVEKLDEKSRKVAV